MLKSLFSYMTLYCSALPPLLLYATLSLLFLSVTSKQIQAEIDKCNEQIASLLKVKTDEIENPN